MNLNHEDVLDAALLPVGELEALVTQADVSETDDWAIAPCRRRNVCRRDDHDHAEPDEWFVREEPPAYDQIGRDEYRSRARELCAGCPVQAACLELALRYEAGSETADPQEPWGIWGGRTESERAQLIEQRRTTSTIRDRARATSCTVRAQDRETANLVTAAIDTVFTTHGERGRDEVALDRAYEHGAAGLSIAEKVALILRWRTDGLGPNEQTRRLQCSGSTFTRLEALADKAVQDSRAAGALQRETPRAGGPAVVPSPHMSGVAGTLVSGGVAA